ncbi:MAG: hypothetical protein ACK4NM_01975 [Hydrogenophaga sp.]
MKKVTQNDSEFAPRPTVAAYDLLIIEISQVDDAIFEARESGPCLTLAARPKPSKQAMDLSDLVMEAMRKHGLPGSDEMTSRYQIQDIGGNRAMIGIAISTAAQKRPSVKEIRLAVAPVLNEIHGGVDLHVESVVNTGTGIPDSLIGPIQEFKRMHGGRPLSESMNLKAGEEAIGIVRGGRWRSLELREVDNRTHEVFAACNGLMCDVRLVYLKECIDFKITGRKYEAHYDQKKHGKIILDTAGRSDRLLKITLKEEVTTRKTILHVVAIEAVSLDGSGFELTNSGQ